MIYETEFRHLDDAIAKAQLYSTVRKNVYYVWKRLGKLEPGERRYCVNRLAATHPQRVLMTSFYKGEEQE